MTTLLWCLGGYALGQLVTLSLLWLGHRFSARRDREGGAA